jgi:hypothetical protein
VPLSRWGGLVFVRLARPVSFWMGCVVISMGSGG